MRPESLGMAALDRVMRYQAMLEPLRPQDPSYAEAFSHKMVAVAEALNAGVAAASVRALAKYTDAEMAEAQAVAAEFAADDAEVDAEFRAACGGSEDASSVRRSSAAGGGRSRVARSRRWLRSV